MLYTLEFIFCDKTIRCASKWFIRDRLTLNYVRHLGHSGRAFLLFFFSYYIAALEDYELRNDMSRDCYSRVFRKDLNAYTFAYVIAVVLYSIVHCPVYHLGLNDIFAFDFEREGFDLAS